MRKKTFAAKNFSSDQTTSSDETDDGDERPMANTMKSPTTNTIISKTKDEGIDGREEATRRGHLPRRKASYQMVAAVVDGLLLSFYVPLYTKKLVHFTK